MTQVADLADSLGNPRCLSSRFHFMYPDDVSTFHHVDKQNYFAQIRSRNGGHAKNAATSAGRQVRVEAP